ncbi:MAG: histidine kinase [Gemmatimonadetes bacterium]|nr:histidine kinase [Gemmatimonadota bacterium]
MLRVYHRLRPALVYLAAWSPLVLLYAVLVGTLARQPASQAVLIALRTIGWAALLGVGARWFSTRYAWPDRLSLTFLLQHLAAATVYAVLWSGFIVLDVYIGLGDWDAVRAQVAPWIGWQTFYGGLLYLLVAGITMAGVASRRARDIESRRIEAEALRVRAELEALRGRLDPHFLFNTLHSLITLARLDPARTEQALGQLAELLRYVLDSKRGAREQVQLADELHFVRTYLALEALRYGDRLRVSMDVEEDALDFVVPSLTVQPLVENAIRHAIAPRASGGAIAVSARFAADALVLTVRDDGDATAASTAGTGLGLDALRQRLRLLYGTRARVEAARESSGYAVTVHVPA